MEMDGESGAGGFVQAFDLTGFVGEAGGSGSSSVTGLGAPGQFDVSALDRHNLSLNLSQHSLSDHQQNQHALQQAMNVNDLFSKDPRHAHSHQEASMMGLHNPHQPGMNAQQMNLDALQQLLAMQLPSDGSASGSTSPVHVGQANGASALLEQQLRLNQLQQLQQLQNQIFQQQIELISGQNNLASGMDASSQGQMFRDNAQFHGLPTPVNSTEIRAQPSANFVSPMILQNYNQASGSTPVNQFTSPNLVPQGSSSAPAHLAFHTHTPLPSPADLDFDLSPLTSPWLEAYQQPEQTPQARPQRSGTKRGASGSGDDSVVQQARKRQSPAIRTSNSGSSGSRKRGSVSITSTPALRSRSRKNSAAGDIVGDTPSPVDLSMPPPAPPSQESSQVQHSQSQEQQQQQATDSTNLNSSPALSPVTPASIMNLGRLGLSSGLSPPLNGVGSSRGAASGKSKTPPGSSAPPNTSGTAGTTAKPIKKAPSASMASPSLKPLLPGGLPPSSAAHLATASNYTHHMAGSASSLNITPATPLPQPTLQVRKTSHKAAEQKRRDSLKTSFDDLRLLLPPIPLPSEDGYDGEAPLPGAMPPRGPPRGEVHGPNRAVSKLQLLRCGNDYIRRLKGRITRRDEYIELLKNEVRDLRAQAGIDESAIEAAVARLARVDLEKDLDAEEANAPKLGGVPMEGDEDDEGGE